MMRRRQQDFNLTDADRLVLPGANPRNSHDIEPPRQRPAVPMVNPVIANLEKLVGGPRDNALLRFSLGNEYLKAGDAGRAAAHLRAALAREPGYSAAWKLLGRALAAAGDPAAALAAYRDGARIAEEKGDKQAAKEMAVFARRIEKQINSGER